MVCGGERGSTMKVTLCSLMVFGREMQVREARVCRAAASALWVGGTVWGFCKAATSDLLTWSSISHVIT
ncbi:F-box protein [Sesbania bispinosa]|nr:F-box protein [Sesbania bispinosa]